MAATSPQLRFIHSHEPSLDPSYTVAPLVFIRAQLMSPLFSRASPQREAASRCGVFPGLYVGIWFLSSVWLQA